jgi:F-type H+-transporting ATPase subunit b
MMGMAQGLVLAEGTEFLTPSNQVLLYTVIVFLLMLGILWKFAWGPLMKALEEREARIAKKIENAEGKFKEAEAKAVEYQRKIQQAKDEAVEIVAEGKRDAEKLREEILAAANLEAEKNLQRAKREIQLAKEHAVDEMRKSIIRMTAQLASEVIRREVREDDHARFVSQGMESFSKNAEKV